MENLKKEMKIPGNEVIELKQRWISLTVSLFI